MFDNLPDLLIVLSVAPGLDDHVLVEQADKDVQYLNERISDRMKPRFPVPGHDRISFSTNCFPINPVAPVIKTVFLLKNSAMPLVSVLADISE